MKLKEVSGDIFSSERECYTNFCCSDFNQAAYQINEEYERRFRTMSQLVATWKSYKKWFKKDGAGAIVTHDPIVMNLVIKEHYFDAAKYQAIDIAFKQAADMCYGLDIFELSIPKVCEGDWEIIKNIIGKNFEDLNMLITIYTGGTR